MLRADHTRHDVCVMFMPCAGSVTSTLQMPASWPLASSTASESVGQCSVSSSSRRGHNLPKTMVSLAACCCTAPLAHLTDIVIAEKPYDSNERLYTAHARHRVVLCFRPLGSDRGVGEAEVAQRPTGAAPVRSCSWVVAILLYCSHMPLGSAHSDRKLRMLQVRKRRSNENQPSNARKQRKADASASPASALHSSRRDDADSEDDMPLGALIAQRRTAVVHAEPRLQTGAAAATAALPADALQQNTDVAAYHDAWAEDTAAASPAIAPQPAAGTGLFTVPIGGRSEHAEAAADTPPSPPSGASRQAATCEKCHTTLQPWPDNRSTTPDQPADHPDAAAAARSLADNAAVDTAADVSALQPPAAAVLAAGAASPEAGAGCAMEHARRHQLEQGSTEAHVPAAVVPSLTAAAGIAADSSLIRTADGAKDSPDSQLPPDAHTVAVLPDGLRGDLLSNAAGLQISCDGGTELLVLRQPEAASPAEAGGGGRGTERQPCMCAGVSGCCHAMRGISCAADHDARLAPSAWRRRN